MVYILDQRPGMPTMPLRPFSNPSLSPATTHQLDLLLADLTAESTSPSPTARTFFSAIPRAPSLDLLARPLSVLPTMPLRHRLQPSLDLRTAVRAARDASLQYDLDSYPYEDSRPSTPQRKKDRPLRLSTSSPVLHQQYQSDEEQLSSSSPSMDAESDLASDDAALPLALTEPPAALSNAIELALNVTPESDPTVNIELDSASEYEDDVIEDDLMDDDFPALIHASAIAVAVPVIAVGRPQLVSIAQMGAPLAKRQTSVRQSAARLSASLATLCRVKAPSPTTISRSRSHTPSSSLSAQHSSSSPSLPVASSPVVAPARLRTVSQPPRSVHSVQASLAVPPAHSPPPIPTRSDSLGARPRSLSSGDAPNASRSASLESSDTFDHALLIRSSSRSGAVETPTTAIATKGWPATDRVDSEADSESEADRLIRESDDIQVRSLDSNNLRQQSAWPISPPAFPHDHNLFVPSLHPASPSTTMTANGSDSMVGHGSHSTHSSPPRFSVSRPHTPVHLLSQPTSHHAHSLSSATSALSSQASGPSHFSSMSYTSTPLHFSNAAPSSATSYSTLPPLHHSSSSRQSISMPMSTSASPSSHLASTTTTTVSSTGSPSRSLRRWKGIHPFSSKKTVAPRRREPRNWGEALPA